MKLRAGAAVALTIASLALLTACASGAEKPPVSASEAGSAKPTDAATAASPSAAPSSSPTPAKTLMPLPGDCREILSSDVLAQLKDVPLNDPGFGDSGLLGDSLVCNWGEPGADTTGLTTKISRMNRGPALDMLNKLAADEGFTCFTPDGGTRCEKTWQNEQYPVTDGRTLFWRDDLLIDTRYSNLAPKGYTQSIVKTLWP